jgi:hypothetical protein
LCIFFSSVHNKVQTSGYNLQCKKLKTCLFHYSAINFLPSNSCLICSILFCGMQYFHVLCQTTLRHIFFTEMHTNNANRYGMSPLQRKMAAQSTCTTMFSVNSINIQIQNISQNTTMYYIITTPGLHVSILSSHNQALQRKGPRLLTPTSAGSVLQYIQIFTYPLGAPGRGSWNVVVRVLWSTKYGTPSSVRRFSQPAGRGDSSVPNS